MEGQSAAAQNVRGPAPRPPGGRRGVRPVWRSVAALTYLFAAVVLLGGCGAMGSERTGDSAGDRKTAGAGVPETARIVCGPEGTRVLTPRVEARPDGVHFEVQNRLGADTGFSALGQEGGAGGDSPKGEKSEHVGDVSPGRARAGCEEPPYDGMGKVHYAAFRVVDPEGLYKSVELECQGGMAVGGGAQYAPGARGVKGDLVEQARSQFSEEIREDDVVELAGYPKLRDHRVVRVVRDGRVIATVHFLGEPGDWLQDRYEACEGF